MMCFKKKKKSSVQSFVVVLLFSVGWRMEHHMTQCHAYVAPSFQTTRQSYLLKTPMKSSSTTRLQMKPTPLSQNEDDAKKNEKAPDPSEPMTLYELAEREAKASKQVQDRLLFPSRLGNAINRLLWLFVLSGFALNMFGYSYIRGENGALFIGTLEQRDFQMEVNKTNKKEAKNKKLNSTPGKNLLQQEQSQSQE